MFGSMFGSGLLCPASLGYRAAWEGAGKRLMVGWRGREARVACTLGVGAGGLGTRGSGGTGDGMFFPSCTAYVPQTQYVPRHRLSSTKVSKGHHVHPIGAGITEARSGHHHEERIRTFHIPLRKTL